MPKMHLAEVIKRDPESNEILETKDLKGFGFFQPYAEHFKQKQGLSRFCPETWAKYNLAGMYLPFEDTGAQLVPYDVIGVKTPDDDWKETQKSRLAFGTYANLPWHSEIEAIDDHFAHVSFNDPTKVAFTENEEKGERDIQTVLTPTKYLIRYYGDALSESEIRRFAGMMQGNLTLRIASTREGIKKVYWFGPRSCMGGLNGGSNERLRGVECFDTDGIHPCETYASGDFEVAYIATRDAESDSEIAGKDCYKDEDFLKKELRISARALVDTKNQEYVRTYCDGTGRLETLLKESGYKGVVGFREGLKLLRLENNSGDIIAPYMDGETQCADERGEYLILNDCGEYTLQETNGLISESGRNYCEYYDERGNFEVYHIVDRNEYWSEMAVENGFAFYCEGELEYYSSATGVAEVDGCTYSEHYALENFSFCEGYDRFFDGETIHPHEYDENSGEITDDDSCTYCEEYADKYLFYSSVFDCYFRNSSDLEKAENDERHVVKVYDVADGIGVLDTFRTITLSDYGRTAWRYATDAETGKCIMAHEKSMLQAAE